MRICDKCCINKENSEYVRFTKVCESISKIIIMGSNHLTLAEVFMKTKSKYFSTNKVVIHVDNYIKNYIFDKYYNIILSAYRKYVRIVEIEYDSFTGKISNIVYIK